MTRLRVAVAIRSLGAVESQLGKYDAFTRTVEVAYRVLRVAPDTVASKNKDEQVDKAVAAIGRRVDLLNSVKDESLSDVERERFETALCRCTALVERLNECRRPEEPTRTENK